MDPLEIIKRARRPERTVELCLRGDLVAEWEQLDRDRAKAEQSTADSLAGNGAAAIAAQMRTLEEQMAEGTIVFRLRALPRVEYNVLFAAHPPRIDAEGKRLPEDAAYGYDITTFWPALIGSTMVEPELDAETLDDLLSRVLSDRQFDELAGAAMTVNRGEVDIPFSRAASRLLQSSAPE